ncbi:hypothetical protein RB195_017935 [Necator americanus]|uniref:Uncharacterized protein n=1 Tax=Necator americanus TaxID=51031 RepID=A0ABR1C9H7_NECAM
MSREGLGDDGGYEALGPGSAEATPKQPAKTPGATTLGQFALRPGDDVDLSSERGGPEDKGPKKSKEKAEREKRLEVPLKSIVLDIKPYKEPTMLKICHTVTLILLVFSFVLMALTVVQFVDIFVWLPMLLGEND